MGWRVYPPQSLETNVAAFVGDGILHGNLGTIQKKILSELAKGERSSNGFIDRILFATPEINMPEQTASRFLVVCLYLTLVHISHYFIGYCLEYSRL